MLRFVMTWRCRPTRNVRVVAMGCRVGLRQRVMKRREVICIIFFIMFVRWCLRLYGWLPSRTKSYRIWLTTQPSLTWDGGKGASGRLERVISTTLKKKNINVQIPPLHSAHPPHHQVLAVDLGILENLEQMLHR
jgi:hypothetical protein